VKKEKVVKKEEGNYVIRFLVVIILCINMLKTFAFEVYYECTSLVLKAVSSPDHCVVDRTQAVGEEHSLIHYIWVPAQCF